MKKLDWLKMVSMAKKSRGARRGVFENSSYIYFYIFATRRTCARALLQSHWCPKPAELQLGTMKVRVSSSTKESPIVFCSS